VIIWVVVVVVWVVDMDMGMGMDMDMDNGGHRAGLGNCRAAIIINLLYLQIKN
jgi:hypothetical protein